MRIMCKSLHMKCLDFHFNYSWNVQKHGPMHIWAKFANATEQIINTSPGGLGASLPSSRCVIIICCCWTDSEPTVTGLSTQTQGPLSCDVSNLSPRGFTFSRPLRLKSNTYSSVLKKQHNKVACFRTSAWMKLCFWYDPMYNLVLLWVILSRRSNC